MRHSTMMHQSAETSVTLPLLGTARDAFFVTELTVTSIMMITTECSFESPMNRTRRNETEALDTTSKMCTSSDYCSNRIVYCSPFIVSCFVLSCILEGGVGVLKYSLNFSIRTTAHFPIIVFVYLYERQSWSLSLPPLTQHLAIGFEDQEQVKQGFLPYQVITVSPSASFRRISVVPLWHVCHNIK